MTKNTQWYGGEKLKAKEKSILEKIDASRVRAFMDSLQRLMVTKKVGGVEVADLGDTFELPGSAFNQSRVEEHFEKHTTSELIWGGMTKKGLGVAFIGTGATQGNQGKRKIPEIGVIADPKRDKTLVLPAQLWHGTADDGWDSGWDQHSYQTADWDDEVSAYKPIDEWGMSRNRGIYEVSLLQDPHFLHNGTLHEADILFSSVGFSDRVQATLGTSVVRLAGEEEGFPAYNFERQITPGDTVLKMNHAVLTSYTSDGS